MKRAALITLGLWAVAAPLCADQVVMKDGTIYKGKIQIDTDKAILIGNPPYDPTSYLLESKDIAKIIYEEYHPLPPAERRRGFVFESRLGGSAFSSSELSLRPTGSLYAGAGFRVHPLFELEGGLDYSPRVSAQGSALAVSDGSAIRSYDSFWMFSGALGGRFYPCYTKKWPIEPFVTVGYTWSRLVPKGSGDFLKGTGWWTGIGAMKPFATHWFLEVRLIYESLSFDTIHFLGHDGTISPEIHERRFGLFTGISYRL